MVKVCTRVTLEKLEACKTWRVSFLRTNEGYQIRREQGLRKAKRGRHTLAFVLRSSSSYEFSRFSDFGRQYIRAKQKKGQIKSSATASLARHGILPPLPLDRKSSASVYSIAHKELEATSDPGDWTNGL